MGKILQDKKWILRIGLKKKGKNGEKWNKIRMISPWHPNFDFQTISFLPLENDDFGKKKASETQRIFFFWKLVLWLGNLARPFIIIEKIDKKFFFSTPEFTLQKEKWLDE